MKDVNLDVICPMCGNNRFRQEVEEIYYRYLDGQGKVLELENDLTHDFEFGTIRCAKCKQDCDNLFSSLET